MKKKLSIISLALCSVISTTSYADRIGGSCHLKPVQVAIAWENVYEEQKVCQYKGSGTKWQDGVVVTWSNATASKNGPWEVQSSASYLCDWNYTTNVSGLNFFKESITIRDVSLELYNTAKNTRLKDVIPTEWETQHRWLDPWGFSCEPDTNNPT
jgi:hypothetical protein